MPTSTTAVALPARLPKTIIPTGSSTNALKGLAQPAVKSVSVAVTKSHHHGKVCCSPTSHAPSKASAESIKLSGLKEQYHKDLSLLIDDVSRFKRETAETGPQDEISRQRGLKIDFFIKYVSNTLVELENATEKTMSEVEEKIKTTLLPLKEKLLPQFHQTTTPLPPPAPVVDEPLSPECSSFFPDPPSPSVHDDGWLTDSSAQSDSGFDDLDLQHLEMLIHDDDLELEYNAPPRLTMMTINTDKGCCLDDDMTDSASLTSDSEPNTPKRSLDSFLSVESMVDIKIETTITHTEKDDEQQQPSKRLRLTEEVPAASPSSPLPVPPPPPLPPSMTQTTVSVTSSSSSSSRSVEYQCSLCSETYPGSVAFNPWWAMVQEECPKCHKLQVPRIDISVSANAIEYHPALLAEEGEEDSDDETCMAATTAADLAGCLEEENDNDNDEDEWPMEQTMASKLMVLLSHASTCPGHHTSPAHDEVCRSAKFLMLHVRDCDGKLLDGTPCNLPWCLPCKQVLSHMSRCLEQQQCSVCNPTDLPKPLEELRGLNWNRLQVVTCASEVESPPSSMMVVKEEGEREHEETKGMDTMDMMMMDMVDGGCDELWGDLDDMDVGLSHEELQLCMGHDDHHHHDGDAGLMLLVDDLLF